MTEYWQQLWQLNIEFSLLLLIILGTRMILRKSAGVTNAYPLWAALPLGLLAAGLAHQLEIANLPLATMPTTINEYVVLTGQTVQAIPDSSWLNLGLIWSIGALLLLLRLAWQHCLLRRELVVISSPLERRLNSAYPIQGINKPSFSPAVYGFVRPTIYFPNHLFDELEAVQIELIIRHEEQHIKQKHLWLNLAWDILVCCMWFNPLLYIGRQQFRHDQELFCDYLVLNNGNQEQQKSYGLALLSTVSTSHSVSLLCSWRAFNQLEERIMNIKQMSSLRAKIATVFGALLVTLAASVYGVSAKEQSIEHRPHSQPHEEESFHVQHFDDQWQIEWQKNGDRLVRDNNDFFVIENGQRRPMNHAERRAFEEKVEASEAQRHESEIARRMAREEQAERRYEERIQQQEHRKIKEREKIKERQSQQAMLRIKRTAALGERRIAANQKRYEKEKAKAEAELVRAEAAVAHAEKRLSLLDHERAVIPVPAKQLAPSLMPKKSLKPTLPEAPKSVRDSGSIKLDFDPSKAH